MVRVGAVRVELVNFLCVIFYRVLYRALIVETRRTVVVRMNQFIVAELTFAIRNVPIKVLIRRFPTIRHPFPVVYLRSNFFTGAVGVFVMSLRRSAQGAAFFRRHGPFFPFNVQAIVRARPRPIFGFANECLFYPRASFVVCRVASSFDEVNCDCLVNILDHFRHGPNVDQGVFRLFVDRGRLFYNARMIVLFAVVVLLYMRRNPRRFVSDLVM